MAFNKTVFKTRALTALIFVLVMLSGLMINAYTFFVLVSIIHFGAWWEYFTLMDKINKVVTNFFIRIGFATMGFALLIWTSAGVYQLDRLYLRENFCLFVSVFGFLLTVIGIFKTQKINLTAFLYAAFGFLYISLSCALWIELASTYYYPEIAVNQWLPFGLFLPCFILVAMWINDTMAYLVGSFIGKTPLSVISPKKTWEGTIGGILLCGLFVGLAMFALDREKFFNQPAIIWIVLALCAAVLGTLGDLFESKLKRMADVKDSGNFMPGHGGFLDRFDSLIFSIPYMWVLFHFIL